MVYASARYRSIEVGSFGEKWLYENASALHSQIVNSNQVSQIPGVNKDQSAETLEHKKALEFTSKKRRAKEAEAKERAGRAAHSKGAGDTQAVGESPPSAEETGIEENHSCWVGKSEPLLTSTKVNEEQEGAAGKTLKRRHGSDSDSQPSTKKAKISSEEQKKAAKKTLKRGYENASELQLSAKKARIKHLA
jgi:hypothetical protein